MGLRVAALLRGEIYQTFVCFVSGVNNNSNNFVFYWSTDRQRWCFSNSTRSWKSLSLNFNLGLRALLMNFNEMFNKVMKKVSG